MCGWAQRGTSSSSSSSAYGEAKARPGLGRVATDGHQDGGGGSWGAENEQQKLHAEEQRQRCTCGARKGVPGGGGPGRSMA